MTMILKVAWFDATGWHNELVDTAGITGFFPSLALDSLGHPHIAYYNLTGTSLRYAYKTDSGWRFSSLDTAGDVGWNPSIAITTGDFPAISYYSATEGDLKYATFYSASLTFLPVVNR